MEIIDAMRRVGGNMNLWLNRIMIVKLMILVLGCTLLGNTVMFSMVRSEIFLTLKNKFQPSITLIISHSVDKCIISLVYFFIRNQGLSVFLVTRFKKIMCLTVMARDGSTLPTGKIVHVMGYYLLTF